MSVIDNKKIEEFLEGTNPKKYVVAVESYYDKPYVTLVINDPSKEEKEMERYNFKPFLWFKEDVTEKLYGGKKLKTIEACKKYGIKIKKLQTSNEEGFTPNRMENGYKFLAVCNLSYNHLVNFFKEGGIDVFKKENKDYFVMFNPTEQFLIQSGIRLFKGMDDYNDLHRFQFDLETEGLFATRDAIFQVGVRDNKGLEGVIEVVGSSPSEKREKERQAIIKFFKIIDAVKPDIIAGYNSENFDWGFLFDRAERLGLNITDLAITLNRINKIKRKPATLKLGGETESYNQTHMYGYNIIDISHSVRRAMAINSEIKSWGLKYITQFSGIAKPNRVYVPGDKINTTWADKINKYCYNDSNGDWYKITDKTPIQPGYVEVSGAYIVERYLCDDLWETEQIDYIYNQASFLISKILPTTFMRASTMGTAGQWKLIMSAWSYENGLAIPATQSKRDFTGGLSRLLEVGYAKNVYKLDFAALYPKTQLTHDIFPELDISGVMKGILTYVVDTRDKFKFLAGKEKSKYKKLEKELKDNKNLNSTERQKLKEEITKHKALSSLYDKKQLPLKILANSWFGSYGAPYIFNWGDIDLAEETTCRGRQYLRLMVRHFTEKYGFRPLVMDTDGCNLAAPDNLNEIKYVAKGTHWKTEENKGVELVGIDAVLAEFNEKFMTGRMGLDLDDVCNSTINFSRKNYANDIDGKIKFVGNSIKSKKMPTYIEEFLNKGIRMLLDGDGYSFINHYYNYVDKIYNYQIPLVKIASKSKVKSFISDYQKKSLKKNKAGNPMPKQAHMELAIANNLDVKLGDIIYYINTGTSKSHGDLKTIDKNKMTKKEREEYKSIHGEYPKPNKVTELNCKLIDNDIVERDFENIKELDKLKKIINESDTTDLVDIENKINEIENSLYTDEYNVAKYLDAFNKKVKPLLVCFSLDIRDKILLDIIKIKNPETKKTNERLMERNIFTKEECALISGKPFKETDQDTYTDLMIMEDKEIRFWSRVNKTPNNMEESDWINVKNDYEERMRIEKLEGVLHEKTVFEDIIQHLEYDEILRLENEYELPIDIFNLFDIELINENLKLVSRKWGEIIGDYLDLFKYKTESYERHVYYETNGLHDKTERYDKWLNHINENKIFEGEKDGEINLTNVESLDNDKIINTIKTKIYDSPIKIEVKENIKVNNSDNDDENDEISVIVNEDGSIIRLNEILTLDDGIDDTFGDKPDDYIEGVEQHVTTDDDWLF